jgi:hypothetical protein
MIDRLHRISTGEIQATDVDRNFYAHELRESTRYSRAGWSTGVPADEKIRFSLWNDAHTATLEEYGLNGENDLYHPEALRLVEQQMEDEFKRSLKSKKSS